MYNSFIHVTAASAFGARYIPNDVRFHIAKDKLKKKNILLGFFFGFFIRTKLPMQRLMIPAITGVIIKVIPYSIFILNTLSK
jgi:hypothetical protein